MFVKICGMTRQQDLDIASSLGANLCGFIFAQKSPRFITPGAAAALDSHGMARVGVFLTDDSGFILRTAAEARLDFIQLHGRQSSATALAAGPSRVIRVLWPGTYPEAEAFQRDLDKASGESAFLLFDAEVQERAFSGHGSEGCISPCPGFSPEVSRRKARRTLLFWETGRTAWTSIPDLRTLRASRTPGS